MFSNPSATHPSLMVLFLHVFCNSTKTSANSSVEALLHIVTLGGSKRFIVAWFLRFLPTLCKAAQISILKNMLQLQH